MRALPRAGRRRGRKAACSASASAPASRAPAAARSNSAIVRVGRSGKVSIYTGAMAMGQGLKTILAQIAADQLGVRPEDITVVSGDTSTIQLGLGGFASRQTVTAGNSVHLAAKAVREKAHLDRGADARRAGHWAWTSATAS